MSSNSTTFQDIDGDFSDWIELYNTGDEEINLENYYLSDSKKNIFKWQFPSVYIPAKGYVIVFASSKDRYTQNGEIHTNFKIDQDGESLSLSNQSGLLVDSVSVPFLNKDFVYARLPNGVGNWQISDIPTPSKVNIPSSDFIQAPIFSDESGFYNNNFKLKLSHPDAGAVIIYTIDGSEPSVEHINGQIYTYKNEYKETLLDKSGDLLEGKYQSLVYQGDINIQEIVQRGNSIANISTTYNAHPTYFPTYNLPKCAIIKAIAYKDGIESEVISHTYFIENEQTFSNPISIVSISTNDTHFFDFDNGIYVAGVDFEDWRKKDALSPVNPSRPANYNRRGRENEFPLTFEMFESQTKSKVLQQTLGFRTQGKSTRIQPQKGIKLYARDEYGKSKLKYSFFPNDENPSYKRLDMRSLYGRRFGDSFFSAMVRHLKMDVRIDRPIITYLNGEYFGMFELKERFDEFYLERKYGVDKDKVDIISNNSIVEAGTINNYNQMINFVKKNPLTNNQNYEDVKGMIDIENYIDYNVAEIFSGNTDWITNNVSCWRYQSDGINNQTSYGHDGKWRWMLFDLDYAFGLVDKTLCTNNTLSTAIGNGKQDYQILLSNLMKNQDFKANFISRFADLLNTTFLPDRLLNIIEQQSSVLRPYIDDHIKRWGFDKEAFTKANDRSKAYVQCRRNEMFKHLRNYFSLGEIYQLTLDVDNKELNHRIKVNTIKIDTSTVGVNSDTYPWSGNYFTGLTVEISAIPTPGYQFDYWENMPEGTPSHFTTKFETDTYLVAHFKEDSGVPTTIKSHQSDEIRIFPNPVQTTLNIIRSSQEKLLYSIMNLQGQTLQTGSLENGSNRIEISQLPSNLYLLDIDGYSSPLQFIKQ
ncbi:MAG: CotH kinase family protein [Chitinophagales bacterium]|nr:CotH kinase family protein [Chitinophagales bacterium]